MVEIKIDMSQVDGLLQNIKTLEKSLIYSHMWNVAQSIRDSIVNRTDAGQGTKGALKGYKKSYLDKRKKFGYSAKVNYTITGQTLQSMHTKKVSKGVLITFDNARMSPDNFGFYSKKIKTKISDVAFYLDNRSEFFGESQRETKIIEQKNEAFLRGLNL